MASLRAAGHRVSLLAPTSSGRALVGEGPAEVERLLLWDRPPIASLFGESAGLAPELRAELAGFDLALVYSRNRSLARGLGSVVPRVVDHDPTPPPGAGHASRWLALPIETEGVPLAEPVPLCVPSPVEDAEAARWREQLPPSFLAVHPGSGSAFKNWPADRFAHLAEALSGDRPWLLVEGPAEHSAASPIEAGAAIRARNLDPRVLGAVLRHAGLFVGNDSGASHLAAAWGAPTLALFGPTDPAVWAPIGPRVRVLRSPTAAMDGLETARVLEAACTLT